jgi:hypothetical protein
VLIRIRISKKNRQHNGQKNLSKRTNNDLQNYTYKTKDQVTRTPLKIGGELRCSGRVISSCSTSGNQRGNLVTNPVINHERGKDREVFTTSNFSFGHCVVCSSIYVLWLPLWYLQAFLKVNEHNLIKYRTFQTRFLYIFFSLNRA